MSETEINSQEDKQKPTTKNEFSLKKEWHRATAEIYGTFVLTFISALGPIAEEITGGEVSLPAAVVAPAFVLAALIYSTAQISGAHFNPSVSFAFFALRTFKWWRMLYFWVSQLIGAILAATVLWLFFGDVKSVGSTVPNHVSTLGAFFLEIIITFLLIFTVINVSQRAKVLGPNAALSVAAMVAAISLVAGGLSGASMNPARSFGPAVIARGHALQVYWIYLVGPFIGATCAVTLTYALGVGNVRALERVATGAGEPTESEPLLGRSPDVSSVTTHFTDERSLQKRNSSHSSPAIFVEK